MSLLEKKLLETTRINDAVYRKVNYITKKYGGTVPLNLVRMNALVEDDLLAFLTRHFGVPSLAMKDLENIGMSVLNLVPVELAKRFRILPFGVSGNDLMVVLSDPTDDKIIDEISFITGRRVQVYATLESIISWALLKYYGVITESGAEIPHTTMPEVPMDDHEEEEIPIPLVTRKRKSAAPAPAPAPEPVQEKLPPEPVKEEIKDESEITGEVNIAEMGGWDAPFELSRASTIDVQPTLTRKELKEEKKRVKRRTPTKMAVPAPEVVRRVEKKDERKEKEKAAVTAPEPVPRIEERKRKQTAAQALGAALGMEKKEGAAKAPEPSKKEAPAAKVEAVPVPAPERPTPKPAAKEKAPEPSKKEAPAARAEAVPVPERPAPKPSTIEKAVVDAAAAAPVEKTKTPEKAAAGEKTRLERDSSVSISPVYIIGPTTAVAETIGKKETEPKPRKSVPPPAARTTFPPPAPAKGAPGKTIEPSRVTRWATFLGTLSETDKVIDAALAFLDTAFGPTIFLRMKKQAASPYRFSLSVPKSMIDGLKKIVIEPPSFAPLWLSLEEGHFALTRVIVPPELQPIMEVNIDAGWEDNPLVLLIPIIIGRTKIGALLSVPTKEWTETPELHETFGVIENTLSKAFGKIIMERKKGML
jgi:hypothetical protein